MSAVPQLVLNSMLDSGGLPLHPTPVVTLCSPRVEKSQPAEETAKSARDSQPRAVGLPALSRHTSPLMVTLRLNHWNLGIWGSLTSLICTTTASDWWS